MYTGRPSNQFNRTHLQHHALEKKLRQDFLFAHNFSTDRSVIGYIYFEK